ncbi:MarR family winged helix-turn-helix transcriptional regulator [Leucobacter sp. USHLN154]|uniref:MarR family winged helix-turn-helix transcriptional regulator n=1 Tax=Leucobacter sp. USHLN154 TaxID=3081269 RepID=UPI003018187F
MTGIVDSARLAGVISPLRRALLSAARAAGDLPEIPDSQIQVIRALPSGTALAPSDLAEALHLDRSTVSNLLASMQRAGLVERRPDEADGRRVLVTTSERARALFTAYDRASTRILGESLETLAGDDLTSIAAALPALERLLGALLSAHDPSLPRATEERSTS